MSDSDDNWAYHRMQAESAFRQASAGSLFVLTSKGMDSQCGCIGCKGDSIACNFNPHFLPDELNGIISFDEFAAMTKEIDEVLKETHFPIMPMFFIPCVGMWCVLNNASQRHRRTDEVLQKYTLPLAKRGYYWEPAPAHTLDLGLAFLKVNKTAAERFLSGAEGTVAPSAVVACADPAEYSLGQEGVEMATAQFIPSAQGEVMKRDS